MRRTLVVRVAVPVALCLALSGCESGEEDALRQIGEARTRLAGLAPHGRTGFARDAIALARESLISAESSVRRDASWLDRFEDAPEWQVQLQRALDVVSIAAFVVERQRAAERAEAEAWIRSAGGVVHRTRGSRVHKVHYVAQSRLSRAEVALDEASRLLAAEEFALATEKAQEAAALAGELPPETRELFARFGDPANLRRWREWVREAVNDSRRHRRPALVVDKRAQMAVLWSNAKPVKWLEVELGYNGLNRKLQEGDGATPEGLYRVVGRKGRGETKYHKALLLDYPNEDDRHRFRQAKANGEIINGARIGGLIEVHGNGGKGNNWTDGCVAVTDRDMDYLFEKLPLGSAVVIVGAYDGPGNAGSAGGGR
jgi:hypothetical protein